MLLEDDVADLQVVTDDPEPDFSKLAAAALDNTGITLLNAYKPRHR